MFDNAVMYLLLKEYLATNQLATNAKTNAKTVQTAFDKLENWFTSIYPNIESNKLTNIFETFKQKQFVTV